ncbi:FtsX-like permease family protein [Phytohabitans rumicis]|uniref:ABC3 transporter permease C-terminal domain-containing protein n=1 Tax=Phytohabitans rumicis TaxID=1076125 RepID=A0A6V8L057_9ACTN|nr:FtsX-like permease family protein [Phytohabitans rumicis]GFJ88970.1 hypothetical protein Prum_026120 [Phytohabitans rumicis]
MSAWRTAMRIAWRESRRAKGRSALVIAMIALPVFALSFAAASYDMFRLTPEEKVTRQLGAADALIRWETTGPLEQDPTGQGWSTSTEPRQDVVSEKDMLAALPPGSRVTPTQDGIVELRTATGVGSLNSAGLDLTSPLVSGRVKLLDGRAPASDGEVAITEKAVGRLGAQIGDTIQNPDGTKSWTVTGIVEFPDELYQTVVFRPGAVPSENGQLYAANQWLWDAPRPVNWEQVKQLNLRGMMIISRAVLLDPPPADASGVGYESSNVNGDAIAISGLIAGLGILEIVLLAGPAFAVGARRRRRDLGLIAANGGTPAHLRRIVLADGIVLGALGAAAGLVLGLALAFIARPLVEVHLVQARAGGYRIFPLALAGITLLAIGTGLLAALVPAFTAAKSDVVAALTGRRGAVRSRKRWLFTGLAMVVAGVAVTVFGAQRVNVNVILAGLVVGELGIVLCTPTLVGLIARLGRVLPLTPRIALRDTARNRAAAAPAIAAVMAAVAGSVAVGVYFSADEERNDSEYAEFMPHGHAYIHFDPRYVGPNSKPDDEPKAPPAMQSVAALARDTLPVRDAVVVAEIACPAGTPADVYCGLSPRMPKDRECPWFDDTGGPLSRDEQRQAVRDPRCQSDGGWYNASYGGLIATPDAVPALIGATGDDLARARATIEAGGVLVNDERYLVDGKVTLEIYDARQGDGTTTEEDRDRLPTVTVPGYAPTTGTRPPSAILSAGAARAANMAQQENSVVVATTRMPTQAEQDRLNGALRGLSEQFSLTVERGPDRSSDPTLLILAAAAGLITLGAAGIATGLAAADGRADLATLAAVGASPGVRRRLSLSQSGVIAGLGSVLGVVAGLGASAAVLTAYNQASADRWPQQTPYPIAVPWEPLVVVLLVPLVAMLGAGLLTRSRLPVETRRT